MNKECIKGHNVPRLNMEGSKYQLVNKQTHSNIVYYLSSLFESSDLVYRVVFMQLPKTIWYLKAPFIKMMLENVFNGNEVPYWATSFRQLFIRKQPHGPNQLSRTANSKGGLSYPQSVIAFTHKVNRTASSLERHSLSYAISKLHNIFANNTNGMNEALHSWSCENQPGAISYFKNKMNQRAMLGKFKNDIHRAFKAKRVINGIVALDKFLLDLDIKQFVQNEMGMNSWPKRYIRFIYGRFDDDRDIPEFDRIQKVSLDDE